MYLYICMHIISITHMRSHANKEDLDKHKEEGHGKVNIDVKFIFSVCKNVYKIKKDLDKHQEEEHEQESVDIAENAEIAQELEKMVERVKSMYKPDCHDCDMRIEMKTVLRTRQSIEVGGSISASAAWPAAPPRRHCRCRCRCRCDGKTSRGLLLRRRKQQRPTRWMT